MSYYIPDEDRLAFSQKKIDMFIRTGSNDKLFEFSKKNICSKEYIVYSAIINNNNKVFDYYYNRDTHNDSFLSYAIEYSNVYATEVLLYSDYATESIVNFIHISLFEYELNTCEFTEQKKVIINMLVDYLVNVSGILYDTESHDPYYQIQYNNKLHIKYAQCDYIRDKCINECARTFFEKEVCRSIGNMLWSSNCGPNLYEYLKP